MQNDTTPTLLQVDSGPSCGPAVAPLQPPPILPDFEILEELGRGGMGIVYRARQLADQQIVAIKVIRKDRLQHEEAVRRFRREAQAAARLCHPNIVQVVDSDHTGDTHFLVMEYVPGLTLERYVEQYGPLPIAVACDYLRQAALGLQHAHEQALVHRDIKPSNLMVTPAPAASDPPTATYQIKVLDMGVARVLQLGPTPGESLSTLTQGGSVIGTADYIAPEQLEDPHGADIRADLYSLGCTFYFLLTGQVPFPGGSLISKLDKQRWQMPEPVEQIRAEVPRVVARLLGQLLAKKPADRFQTPGALAKALTRLAKYDYQDPPVAPIAFKELRRLTGHRDAVWSVRWSPDGRTIASGARDCLLMAWNAETGEMLRTFPAHPQEVRSVAFSPSEGYIASASGLTIRLWDIHTGQPVRRFTGHSGAIKCLTFSEDGKRLISGSDDRTIRVWEVQTGREVQRFSKHTDGITALAVVPEANQLISAGRDQTIRLWDLRTDQELHSYDAYAGAVLDVAVSPDGRRLASAHYDTVVRLWDLASANQRGEFVGHKQMVSALAFAPDGQRLVSAGQDQTLRLWDLATFTELTCFACHSAGINALSLSPDGQRVATAGTDMTLAVLALPAQVIVSE